LPSASSAVRLAALPASIASRPAFVTIAKRPSLGTGRREFVEMICPTAKAEYFCKWGWTGNRQSD
jgi:hypothetical protein